CLPLFLTFLLISLSLILFLACYTLSGKFLGLLKETVAASKKNPPEWKIHTAPTSPARNLFSLYSQLSAHSSAFSQKRYIPFFAFSIFFIFIDGFHHFFLFDADFRHFLKLFWAFFA